MLSYAQMMRDFKSKNISLEMTYRFGNEIPEKLKGLRKVTKVQTKAIYLLRSDGKESWLELPNAKLVYCDEKRLSIYSIGKRELTEEENKLMQEWKAITETEDYKKKMEYDVLTDYHACFYQEKRFWTEKDMLHLFGTNWVKGMKRDHNSNMVFDSKIKGDLQLEYRLEVQ
jgi:hypothetical protein